MIVYRVIIANDKTYNDFLSATEAEQYKLINNISEAVLLVDIEDPL